MSKFNKIEEIKVWQESVEFSVYVYKLIAGAGMGYSLVLSCQEWTHNILQCPNSYFVLPVKKF